jgi:plastocyanin
MTNRARFLAVPAVLALTAWTITAFGGSASASGTGAIASAATASHLITPKNIKFHPGVLHVARGDSVTWKWEDADIDT